MTWKEARKRRSTYSTPNYKALFDITQSSSLFPGPYFGIVATQYKNIGDE
jgi:hypothetical protein